MEKLVFSNSLDAARKLTEQIVVWLNEDKERNFYIAVSGGSTPIILFHVWYEFYLRLIDWNRLHIFWVDERCVDPRSSDSNYGMTKRILLDQVPIPATNIHRIFGEIDSDFEKERYSKVVNDTVPLVDGVPAFDLILLGLGDDGHTASIFSNKPELLTSTKIYDVSRNPKDNSERISMTGTVILHAKRLAFFVTGESKAVVLHNIFAHNNSAESYPAYYIAKRGKEVYFYLEQNAGRLLTYP